MSDVIDLRKRFGSPRGPPCIRSASVVLRQETIEALKQVPRLNAEIRDVSIVYKVTTTSGCLSTQKG